jgi:hypothetical protein
MFISVGCILALAKEEKKLHFGGKASKRFANRDKDLMTPCENHRSEVDIELQKDCEYLVMVIPSPCLLGPIPRCMIGRSLSSPLCQTILTQSQRRRDDVDLILGKEVWTKLKKRGGSARARRPVWKLCEGCRPSQSSDRARTRGFLAT